MQYILLSCTVTCQLAQTIHLFICYLFSLPRARVVSDSFPTKLSIVVLLTCRCHTIYYRTHMFLRIIMNGVEYFLSISFSCVLFFCFHNFVVVFGWQHKKGTLYASSKISSFSILSHCSFFIILLLLFRLKKLR